MAMRDVLDMRRDYFEHEKPKREAMACAAATCAPKASDKTHMMLFIVFMLAMTLVYMAWSIHHTAKVRESLQNIADEMHVEKMQTDKKVNVFLRQLKSQGVDPKRLVKQ